LDKFECKLFSAGNELHLAVLDKHPDWNSPGPEIGFVLKAITYLKE